MNAERLRELITGVRSKVEADPEAGVFNCRLCFLHANGSPRYITHTRDRHQCDGLKLAAALEVFVDNSEAEAKSGSLGATLTLYKALEAAEKEPVK